MTYLLGSLVYVALVGLILSVIAHLFGMFGLPQPLGQATWMLHIGIFLVVIPAGFLSKRLPDSGGANGREQVDVSGCPRWFQYVAGGLFAYAVVNFITFLAMSHGMEKGEANDSLVFRGFSGHWMVFYAMAAMVLESSLVLRQRGSSDTNPRPTSGKKDPPNETTCDTTNWSRWW